MCVADEWQLWNFIYSKLFIYWVTGNMTHSAAVTRFPLKPSLCFNCRVLFVIYFDYPPTKHGKWIPVLFNRFRWVFINVCPLICESSGSCTAWRLKNQGIRSFPPGKAAFQSSATRSSCFWNLIATKTLTDLWPRKITEAQRHRVKNELLSLTSTLKFSILSLL